MAADPVRILVVGDSISQGSSLGVIAEKNCEIGLVAYEMTLMVERAGEVLTPDLVAELKNLLTV